MTIIDRIDSFATRFRRPLAVACFAWLMINSFAYAGLYSLPKIVTVSGWAAIGLAAVANGLWWGMVHPRIEQHRATRVASNQESARG